MRDERRNEHEVALRHFDVFLVVLAEVNAGAAGKQIGAGFGLAMMVRQRAEAGRVRGLAEPGSGRRRMLRADARHQLQTARLGRVAMLMALSGDHWPVICSHLNSPSCRPNGSDTPCPGW